MENQIEPRKRRGRPAGQKFSRYTVTLDPELAEWAMDQPEGLSGLVRDSLKAVFDQRSRGRVAKTRIWILLPMWAPEENDPANYPWHRAAYEMSFGFIVAAENEQNARYIAGAYAGEEEGTTWLDPELTQIHYLSDGEEPGIIMSDFRRNKVKG